jgi:nitrite reductase (cytochrome c-552)
VAAANALGFHSPVEAGRVLGSSIEKAQEARLIISRVLAVHGVMTAVPPPDISTREKAQAFIGLDMSKLRAVKAEFLKTVVPQWDAKAEQRQRNMPVERKD